MCTLYNVSINLFSPTIFPHTVLRLGINHSWRGRQTICQQSSDAATNNRLESDQLRRIRLADSAEAFHRLLRRPCRNTISSGGGVVAADVAEQLRCSRSTINPISASTVRDRRTTNAFRVLEPNDKRRIRRRAALEPHVGDDDDDENSDDGDDGDDNANEDAHLDWYTRLATRCYRSIGLEWHVNYLLRQPSTSTHSNCAAGTSSSGHNAQHDNKDAAAVKTTTTTAYTSDCLTRRPLQRFADRHHKEQQHQRQQKESQSELAVRISPNADGDDDDDDDDEDDNQHHHSSSNSGSCRHHHQQDHQHSDTSVRHADCHIVINIRASGTDKHIANGDVVVDDTFDRRHSTINRSDTGSDRDHNQAPIFDQSASEPAPIISSLCDAIDAISIDDDESFRVSSVPQITLTDCSANDDDDDAGLTPIQAEHQ